MLAVGGVMREKSQPARGKRRAASWSGQLPACPCILRSQTDIIGLQRICYFPSLESISAVCWADGCGHVYLITASGTCRTIGLCGGDGMCMAG